MSNIFKSNTRFSALVDDISQQKNNTKKNRENNINSETNVENKGGRFNSFKSERPFRSETNFSSFNENRRERYRLEREEEIKAQKESEQRERDRILEESLKIENFPDLVVTAKKKETNENINKMNYAEKLKKEEVVKVDYDSDLEKLNPGWILLKRDPITGETIFKSHHKTLIVEKEPEKTDQETMMDILKALSELHEKRTQEYIENYGYDEWEREFKFPDWREREAWLEEMEEMENQTDESEYEEEDEE